MWSGMSSERKAKFEDSVDFRSYRPQLFDHRAILPNVLNLLIQMGDTLRGYNFSRLVVRQAYLQGVDLPEVNFARANLATSVFTDTFGSIHCVTLSW